MYWKPLRGTRHPPSPNVGTAQGARRMTGSNVLRYWVRKQNESVESIFDVHEEPRRAGARQADSAGRRRHYRCRHGPGGGYLRQQAIVRDALCRARAKRRHSNQHCACRSQHRLQRRCGWRQHPGSGRHDRQVPSAARRARPAEQRQCRLRTLRQCRLARSDLLHAGSHPGSRP
ncbi:hypothetical protein D3C72_1310480 [compost metagenome]